MQSKNRRKLQRLGLILISLTIFVLAALPRVWQLDAFLMVDENLWYERSASFLQGLTNGDLAQTVQTGHPGVITMWSGSMGVGLYYFLNGLPDESWQEFTGRMVSTPVTLDVLQWLRLPLALLSALSIVLVFWLVRRLFNWPAALLGVGLLAFEPFFIAHSRVLHHDAPTAIFSLLALLFWLLYLKEKRRWNLIFTGIAVALAILSKVSSVFLLGFIGLTLLPVFWQQDVPLKSKFYSILPPFFQVAGIVLLAVVVFWPALWFSPLTTINTILGFIGHESGAHANGSFFLGQFVLDPGPLFYPVGLVFDLSPLTLLGTFLSVGGVIAGWQGARRQVEQSNNWQGVAWLFAYVILFVIFMSFVGKKQQRYILPAMTTLTIVAGWGWYWLLAGLHKLFSLSAQRFLVSVAAVVLVGGQLILAMPHAPYYSTFFNPLLGGASAAREMLLIGRGEGLEQAVAYVLANSAEQPPQISTWYGTTVSTLAQEQAIVNDIMHPNYVLGSDYVFFYINQLQREKPDAATLHYVQEHLPLVHTIQLAGIDYVKIYRGKTASHPIDLFATRNRLEGKAYLSGIDLEKTPVADTQVPLRLFWVNDGMFPGDHFYVRLTDMLEQDWGWGSCQADPVFGEAHTWQDDQFVESECQLEVYPGTPPGTYLLRVGLVSEDGTVIGQLYLSPQEGAVSVERPSEFPENRWIVVQNRVESAVNDDLLLIGYDYVAQTHQPGDVMPLTFYWRALQSISEDFNIQLTLINDTSESFVVGNSVPVNGRYPTSEWIEDEVVRDPWQITLPSYLPNGTYDFELNLFNQAGDPTGSFELPALTIQGRERNFTLSPSPDYEQSVQLGESMRFLGYELAGVGQNENLISGENLDVTLTWQAKEVMSDNYTVFVQLLDEANQVRAQHDSQPGGGELPTTTWAPGEYIRDSHRLALPVDLPAGQYRLIAGMYLPETGERLRVIANGQPVGDYITLDKVLQVSN